MNRACSCMVVHVQQPRFLVVHPACMNSHNVRLVVAALHRYITESINMGTPSLSLPATPLAFVPSRPHPHAPRHPQVLTFDNWADPLHAAMRGTTPWAALYFVFVIVTGNFMILNLFLAILLDHFEGEVDEEGEADESEGCGKEEEEGADKVLAEGDAVTEGKAAAAAAAAPVVELHVGGSGVVGFGAVAAAAAAGQLQLSHTGCTGFHTGSSYPYPDAMGLGQGAYVYGPCSTPPHVPTVFSVPLDEALEGEAAAGAAAAGDDAVAWVQEAPSSPLLSPHLTKDGHQVAHNGGTNSCSSEPEWLTSRSAAAAYGDRTPRSHNATPRRANKAADREASRLGRPAMHTAASPSLTAVTPDGAPRANPAPALLLRLSARTSGGMPTSLVHTPTAADVLTHDHQLPSHDSGPAHIGGSYGLRMRHSGYNHHQPSTAAANRRSSLTREVLHGRRSPLDTRRSCGAGREVQIVAVDPSAAKLLSPPAVSEQLRVNHQQLLAARLSIGSPLLPAKASLVESDAGGSVDTCWWVDELLASGGEGGPSERGLGLRGKGEDGEQLPRLDQFHDDDNSSDSDGYSDFDVVGKEAAAGGAGRGGGAGEGREQEQGEQQQGRRKDQQGCWGGVWGAQQAELQGRALGLLGPHNPLRRTLARVSILVVV